MGTDDLFYKGIAKRKARTEAIMEQRASTWLVVCEGTVTEINYFNRLVAYFNKYGQRKVNIEVKGTGYNTKGVIKKVEDFFEEVDKEVGKVRIPYEKVCVVFDQDSFGKEKFNTAIEMGKARGYIVAWSNECFELWYLEHFNYFNTDLSRNEYYDKLTGILSKKVGKRTVYQKNDAKIFDLLMEHGSLEDAIKNSEKLLLISECETSNAKRRPATNVVEFVKLLKEETKYNFN